MREPSTLSSILGKTKAQRLSALSVGLKHWLSILSALVLFTSIGFSQTYTFTNCGATGRMGPTQAQVNAAYTGTSLNGLVTSNSGIQQWVVPYSGLYLIDARGAQGGGSQGGLGAKMEGEFVLNAGDTILILVGQRGPSANNDMNIGGGGGSYVVRKVNNGILLIAGGGGASRGSYANIHGTMSPNGQDGAYGGATVQGAGGQNGQGGGGASCRGGGGAGWLSAGLIGGCGAPGGQGGIPFNLGGQGGATTNGCEGGFGGGGSSDGTNTAWTYAGGGGGYSGGGGASETNTTARAGGGGSLNNGAAQNNATGVQSGNGLVVISALSTGAVNDIGVTSIDEPNIYCAGTHNVVATIMNFGGNQVTSATIQWSVNGVLQTANNFTGLLDTFGGANPMITQVNIGSYTFSTSAYNIKAWTSMPNGVADTFNQNDTTIITVQSSLPPPTNISVSSQTGVEATLSWSGGSGNTWLYFNGPVGTTPTGTGTAVSTPSVTILNLTSELTYDFYVREVCPTGDTSLWAGPFTYTTPFYCPPLAYCFTTSGATGYNGPTQAQVNTEYTGTTLQGGVTSNNGVQQWTVPNGGYYLIEAFGAEGGGSVLRPGGKGAFMSGEFILNAGTVLNIIVGQTGEISPAAVPAGNRGGGGGSFVWDNAQPSQPLIAAGGGGGTNVSTTSPLGMDAVIGTGGTLKADNTGNPGTNGTGASAGGAGFLTNSSAEDNGVPAMAAVNGGIGGDGYAVATHYGGFGGGGGGGGSPSTTYASGGGGGYSGGAGQGTPASIGGGGGGSYNTGQNQVNAAGVRSGHGVVRITPLSTGATNDIGMASHNAPTIYCAGSHNLVVTIINFGANQVSSATVNWSVNGVAQTPYTFSGLLDTMGGVGSVTAQVTIGSYNFTSTAYQLKYWTSMPNGMVDTVNFNDTLGVAVQSSLPAPGNLTADSIEPQQAAFSWTGGSANSWLYLNLPAGTPPTGVGTAVLVDSVLITGLTPSTDYEFYVREVCPGGDTSQWAGPLGYRTLCLPIYVDTVMTGSRCGTGGVTLHAGTSPGGALKWYTGPSGGIALDTGATFVTPVITTTTDFYVAAVSGLTTISATVGTGVVQNTNTTYPAPYGNWYWGAKSQYLILASELIAAGISPGAITSIGFDVVQAQGVPLSDFTIMMGSTTTNSLIAWQTGLTTVYSSLSYTETSGWNTHTFTTPFIWDGSSNIVIQSCFNNSSYTNNAIVNQSNTPFASSMVYFDDVLGVCQTTIAGSTYNQRPNMQFEVEIGCESPRIPVTATVIPLPLVDIGNDTFYCESGTINLTLNAGNPGHTYQWSTGASSQTINVNTAGVYTVTVTAPNTCQTVDQITVLRHPNPVVDIGGDTSICEGTPTFFVLNAGNPGASFMWSTGSQGASTIVTQPGMYSVTVTSPLGCKTADTMTITQVPAPSVSLRDTIACEDETIVLDAGNPGSTYMWSDNSTTQTLTITSTGLYQVTVTNQTGCSANDVAVVTIHPTPVVNLGNDTLTYVGAQVTLDAGNPGATYLWSTGATTRTITVSAHGTYSVTVTDANGCEGTATFINEPNSIHTVDGLGKWSVFPNPTDGDTHIRLELFRGGKVAIELYDPSGRRVWEQSYSNATGTETITIPMQGLAQGMYLVRVRLDGQLIGTSAVGKL